MNIPTLNEQNVTTSNVQAAPQRSLADPAAHALGYLGNTLQGVGHETMDYAHQQQVKANSSAVMDAYATTSLKIADADQKFRKREGQDAQDVAPAIEEYDKISNEGLDGLHNPEQKRLLKMKMEGEKLTFSKNLYRHAAEQADILNKKNSAAVMDIETQKLSSYFRDPSQYDISNPTSQINKLRAAAADNMYMHGVPEGDPAFKDGIDKATSKAYVDRIKLLNADNPGEAEHFYQVHQDDIEPHERESLQKMVSTSNDESKGITNAQKMKEHIRINDKTETEMKAMLLDDAKGNTRVYEHSKAELHDMITTVHRDNVSQASDVGIKIEELIDKAHESGEVMSLSKLHAIPEYKQLAKMTHDEGQAELRRINAHRNQYVTEHTQQVSAQKLNDSLTKQAESQRRRDEKDSRDRFMVAVSDPETLTTMAESDLKEQGRKEGLKYAEITKLTTQRKKYLKDGDEKDSAQGDSDYIKSVISNMPGVDSGTTSSYVSKAKQFIRETEKDEKRKLKPEERKALIIQAMQHVATTEKHFYGDKTTDKPILESVKPRDYADLLKVARSKGITLTSQQIKNILEKKINSGDK